MQDQHHARKTERKRAAAAGLRSPVPTFRSTHNLQPEPLHRPSSPLILPHHHRHFGLGVEQGCTESHLPFVVHECVSC